MEQVLRPVVNEPSYTIIPARNPLSEHEFAEHGEMVIDHLRPPVVYSLYGHPLPIGVDVTIQAIAGQHNRSARTRLVWVIIRQLIGSSVREHSLPGWQGDNDLVHLLEALPGEDDIMGINETTMCDIGLAPNLQSMEIAHLQLASILYGESAVLDVDLSILPKRVLVPRTAIQA